VASPGRLAEMDARSERWTPFRDQQRDDIAKAVIAAVANAHGDPLNVTEVVELAGISRKTFYKYFDTLSAALVYTQGQVQRQMTVLASASVEGAPNGRERFLGMLSYFATVGRQNPELIRFVNYFDYTFRREGLGAAAATGQGEQGYGAEEIAMAFRDGQSDGSVRTELDFATNVFAAGNSIMGLVQRSQVVGRPDDPELIQASIDLVVDVWRRHLTPTPDATTRPRRTRAGAKPV
jgi:AcrR family transcriptional regulator